MEILEDNQSVICQANNPVFLGRTKHVELKYHFIRDHVGQGNVTFMYCPSETMIADILTKRPPTPHRHLAGVTTLHC